LSKKTLITVCNIFCPIQNDLDILSEYLKTYPVFFSLEGDYSRPTLIVGWDYVKRQYPEQNILDKKINNNVFWTFSKEEDEKKFLRDTKAFAENSLIDWLPKDFVGYDPFFDGDLKDFLVKNMDNTQNTFLYIKSGAMYIFNNNKNYILNLKTLLHFNYHTTESISELFNRENTIIFSYSNVKDVIDLKKFKGVSLESLFWVLYSTEIEEGQLFNIIPNFKYEKYIPFFMNVIYPQEELDENEITFIQRMRERDFITTWLSDQTICVDKNIELKDKEIFYDDYKSFVKINYSNKRTLTNRIVCKDSWNIQNEEKESKRRKQIVSRFEGGKILVCDYTSFESRISIFLTKNREFINKYKYLDIHNEVSSIIFRSDEVNETERKIGKDLNHAMIYGASDARLNQIIQPYVDEPEETLYYVRKLLEPIITNSKKINKECHLNGFIKTPWGSIVRPTKEYAAYNNLVQTIASEIIIDKMIELRSFLKNKKSRLLFQIHDSIAFDVSPEDEEIISKIIGILSNFKASSFSVDYKIGDNYGELNSKKDFAF
jgi:hypothetical protein